MALKKPAVDKKAQLKSRTRTTTRNKTTGPYRGTGRVKTPADAMKAPGAKAALAKANKTAKAATAKPTVSSGSKGASLIKSAGKASARVARAGRGGLLGLAVTAAGFLGSKITNAALAERKTRSKLQKDAANKPEYKVEVTPMGNKSATPSKKYGTTLAGMKYTKGGDYAVYKKDSGDASNFRAAFAAARKGGKKTFEWRGRKYTTEKK